MEEFEGRVAVVTGAASGIGRALADAFAARGMRLVLADIEAGPLEVAAEELRTAGAEVFAVTADVSRYPDVERIGEAAMDVFGGLHVACNNAGVAGGGLTWEVDLATWEWVLGVNLWGVIHGLHAFTPRIIASGGGHIVNTASMAGLTSTPGMSPYNASKHAVVTISESMAIELQMTHPEVGISVLCPGWVRTRINTSERNRPGFTPAADPDEAHALAAMRGVIDRLIAEGLDPAHVAELVVEAMRANRFYVLTHPEWQGMVRTRVDRILNGEPPVLGLPGNESPP
jgi:NAD(P)-dependent dehydrogenase (short-subunit alcohol dehydrogenase family)